MKYLLKLRTMAMLYLPIVFILSLFACKQLSHKQKEQAGDERPNIIFIMADDHAFQAISAYGSELIETPNMDRMAREGMRFDHAFVTNSICAPSRAVILTGKFSHLNGVKDNVDVFDSSQVTFPKILREHGYQTAIVGKWHLKSTPAGFDYWKILPDQGDYYHPEFITEEGTVKEKGYATDVITDIAIHYLDSVRDPTKPFMLMYHHKAPHREWWPSMEDLTVFKDSKIPESPTLFDDYGNRGSAAREAEMRIADHMGYSNDNKIDPKILQELNIKEFIGWYEEVYRKQYNRLTDEEKQKWDAVYGPINAAFKADPPKGEALTRWRYQRYMEDYLATILSVDRNVGRLIDHLEAEGLLENTMIIYTSDQGFFLGEHGWFDKRFMYEPSFRTPLIIYWPQKIKPGQVNTDLVQNIDFAPTFLEAAGIAIPADMQGKSLIPIFEGNDSAWRGSLYYHYYEFPSIHMVKRHYGIRTAEYKLIHFYYDVDEWELYDLDRDPDEMNNVYDDPEYGTIRESLHYQLDSLRVLYGDSDEMTLRMLREDLERSEK